MKALSTLLLVGSWFLVYTACGQPGLKGEYYTGTNFEHKVFTRLDPTISFDWEDHRPGPNMPMSYYSVRWTGKLLAPVSGEYRFAAKVDDGIRVWVGNKKVMESWQLNDSKGFSGSVVLEAGHYYDLRVDYFNDVLEGEIELYWQLPRAKKQFQSPFSPPGEPIAAKYFFQKAPVQPQLPKLPIKPVNKPIISVPATVKVNSLKPPPVTVVTRKSTPTLAAKNPMTSDTVTTPVVSVHQPVLEPSLALKPGTTVILHHVQFEQSSYTLLPESTTELNQLVSTLTKNPTWHIAVAGHTDNVGDPRLNQALSENRAKVVSHYLVQRGIADDRITVTGYGGTHALTNNTTESERSKNRRVEITIK